MGSTGRGSSRLSPSSSASAEPGRRRRLCLPRRRVRPSPVSSPRSRASVTARSPAQGTPPRLRVCPRKLPSSQSSGPGSARQRARSRARAAPRVSPRRQAAPSSSQLGSVGAGVSVPLSLSREAAALAPVSGPGSRLQPQRVASRQRASSCKTIHFPFMALSPVPSICQWFKAAGAGAGSGWRACWRRWAASVALASFSWASLSSSGRIATPSSPNWRTSLAMSTRLLV